MKKKGNSAMAIGHNEDLITLILFRLPAKSIVRFKTVSKQWLSILSSSRFRQIHAASASASDSATATGRLIFNKDTALGFVSLDNHTCPMPNSDQPIQILSSSGGLLLLLLQSRDYCICNPATNEIKLLAAAVPQVINESTSVVACLAFDPCKSLHYKILFVYAVKKRYNMILQSMIYSSETTTFRSLKTTFTYLPRRGIYWNDAIHWISRGRESDFSYFDLSTECMNVHRVSGVALYIGEYRGHLLAVTLSDDVFRWENSLLRVYESGRDYSGWSLKYKFDIASLGIQFPRMTTTKPPIYGNLCISGFLFDEEQDLSMVLLLRDHTFVACNLNKKLSTVLAPRAHPSNRYFICQYKETLALV